jgi:hypothetical protein
MTNWFGEDDEALRQVGEAAHDWRRDERDDDTSGWRSPGEGIIWRVRRRCGLTHKTSLRDYESGFQWEDNFTLPSGEELGLEEASELECPEDEK